MTNEKNYVTNIQFEEYKTYTKVLGEMRVERMDEKFGEQKTFLTEMFTRVFDEIKAERLAQEIYKEEQKKIKAEFENKLSQYNARLETIEEKHKTQDLESGFIKRLKKQSGNIIFTLLNGFILLLTIKEKFPK